MHHLYIIMGRIFYCAWAKSGMYLAILIYCPGKKNLRSFSHLGLTG